MSHISIGRVTHMNDMCNMSYLNIYIYLCMYVYIFIIVHVTHISRSCHTYQWYVWQKLVFFHWHMWRSLSIHDYTYIYIRIGHLTHIFWHVWRSFTTHVSVWYSFSTHDSLTCVTRPVDMCDMNYHIYIYTYTYIYLYSNSLWHTYHWYVRHDLLICVTWVTCVTVWHESHVWLCDMSHMCDCVT